MRKVLLIILIFAAPGATNAQQIMSPDQFLEYPLGSAYTNHDHVVAYFKTIAASSQRVKLETYGKTNEGKSLIYAVVSSEENMNNIAVIRKNYMNMSGMDGHRVAGDPNMPVVIWLSYNVHGNEASSTEVSMKVLYELVSRNDHQMKTWLKNTVIIIDPCLNPDGRDRYVNWYNQTKGVVSNPNLSAREHEEPWPGGRVNHYYFDLNRDWAWQTQIETQARSVIYHQWMPAIHCDFHEQGIDAPYYFAPAAEPFHEVITTWQRNFQQVIGKHHANYFDKNGWLYFTKEIFDLFYPSYGDTYPLYNGSIGMTYEQAGHSASGIEVKVGEDLLTLKDRIEHHFTTSMSTIEVAAENAVQINKEYQHYFNELFKNGNGDYHSYVIDGSDLRKLAPLKKLLDQNHISYSLVKEGIKANGFHFFSNKEENYIAKAGDLVVSTHQPTGALARVLFEPQSKLSDSLTYDITAWSLPYVYGIDAWAIRDRIESTVQSKSSIINLLDTSSYANLVEYRNFESGKLLASLLREGIQVKISEKDFTYQNHLHKKGTLIILKQGNKDRLKLLQKLISEFDVNVYPVKSGFMDSGVDFGSEKIHALKPMKVALLSGDEASSNALGEVWHFFDKELKYPITLVNASSINAASLKDFDVVIAADGRFELLTEKESPLKTWVKNGGRLIALENAVSQMASGDWDVKLQKASEDEEEQNVSNGRYENREREALSNNTPGAIFRLSMDDSHPMAFGYDDFFYLLKMNAKLLETNKDIWSVLMLNDTRPVSGFVGTNVLSQLNHGSVFTVQQYGEGMLVCSTDNIIFRDFWENGKLLLLNSVFMYAH